MVDYDQVLALIGECGSWHKKMFLLLSIVSAASGLAVVTWSFVAIQMPNHCGSNIQYCKFTNSFAYDAHFSNLINPSKFDCQYLDFEELKTRREILSNPESSCETYKAVLEAKNDITNTNNSSNTTLKSLLSTTHLTYEYCNSTDLIFSPHSLVQSSLTTDFGLTCENDVYRGVIAATYMLGMLFGSFILGSISDTYGRKPTLILSIIIMSVSGSLGALANTSLLYAMSRFLTGIGGIGCFMVTFVLAIEYVGHKYNTLIGIAIEIPFAIGEFILGVEAYFIRDWRMLQLVAYAPLIFIVILHFFIPESPRWLISNKKIEKANKIIQRIAKENKVELYGEVMKTVQTINEKDKLDMVEELADTTSCRKSFTFLDLFIPHEMAIRTINMFYQWFSVTLCYYGLSFASTSLSGDPYTNFMLSVLVEIPGYIFCIFIMDVWGRRPILSFCQALSGMSCIGAGLLIGNESLTILQVMLSLMGKFGASACFAIVYVYTAELFATHVRNTAIGSCSCVARVGGICSLLISMLGRIWKPMPMVVMGGVAVIAGILALNFPETAGQRLPTTQEEALHMGKDEKRKRETTPPIFLKIQNILS